MFHLRTEYFSWSFSDWAINFFLAVLLVSVISTLVAKTWKVLFVEDNENTAIDKPECGLENTVGNFRDAALEIWTRSAWINIAAIFFVLLLFLVALYIR